MKSVQSANTVSQINLFGGVDVVAVDSVRGATIQKARSLPKPIDRYREKGIYGGNIKVKTSPSDLIIECMETALGLKPLKRNGKWCREGSSLKYNFNEKNKFLGSIKMGERASILRDHNTSAYLSIASSEFSPLFNMGEDSELVKQSMDLLALRFRVSSPEEDPSLMVLAIKEILCQQDFIDNSRTGETIRRNMKRESSRISRAKEMVKKAESKGEILTFDDAMTQIIERSAKANAVTDHSELETLKRDHIIETDETVVEEQAHREIDEFAIQELTDHESQILAYKGEQSEVEILEDYSSEASDDDLVEFGSD